ncbi:MAG: putative 6-carboxy-5 6 7 8-tetrahydropterin synthase [Prokaryotic dsDNA virus sp.]|nr:MAG: putative 6-carboxy-5 6 7 8-tetrahydropterin synthase [Prokaryotic dsDNA virus sp.]QDP65566.1 MAG: putative 6-carboxy-5 6 7 8-tetrahydropterin synthase [Prokaryotic dsDNA virus sp.]|tara:strand:- start:18327 stop:18737 length:411 start_codon:yes stop_codon:yes gene_type:complete
MEIKIEKKYHFYAAHRNKEAGEKCGRIHGHTYNIKCIFKFNEMNNGVTMLFSDIDKIVEPIIKQYDHYFLLFRDDPLCELLELANEPYIELPFETSAENMAIWIYNQIKTKLPIIEIQLGETKTSKIIYNEERIKH